MMHFNGRDLYGCSVRHGDEVVGVLRDLLFDRRTWIVRYLVVETGAWPSPRRVLLEPSAVESFEPSTASLQVSLARAELADCPLGSAHPPASQQYVRRLTSPPSPHLHWADERRHAEPVEDDPYLESSQQIIGYRLVGSRARNERVIDLRFQTAEEHFRPTVVAMLTRSFWTRRRRDLPVAHVEDVRHYDQRLVTVGG